MRGEKMWDLHCTLLATSIRHQLFKVSRWNGLPRVCRNEKVSSFLKDVSSKSLLFSVALWNQIMTRRDCCTCRVTFHRYYTFIVSLTKCEMMSSFSVYRYYFFLICFCKCVSVFPMPSPTTSSADSPWQINQTPF